MRRLLALACRAFPPEHRARQSDEVVDTALLASRGSTIGALREALSVVGAGLSQRVRGESRRSVQDGVRLLAGVLAVVNLAVALAGVWLVSQPLPIYTEGGTVMYVFGVDWWWVSFTAAAAAIVVGLALGSRRLAVAAAIANVAIVGYDALFVVNGTDWFSGHLSAFTYAQQTAFPVSGYWLPGAILLVLATAAAPLRRQPLKRLPLALAAALMLVLFSHEIAGSFLFLLWPLTAIVLLAVAFGGFAPRLAVLAVGGVLVAAPSVVGYSTQHTYHHSPVVTWVAAGLAIGLLLPLGKLARHRLT
jgi:hypothetical protein